MHTSSAAEFLAVFGSRFCWGFLGIAFVRLWIQYYIHSFYFMVDIGELSIASKLFRGVLILILAAVLARTGLSPRGEALWRWLSFVLMMLSGILFFLQMQLSPSNMALGTLGAFSGAVGVIWGGGMWMQLFVRMRPGEAFLYIVGSLGLGSLLGFLFGFLPDVAAAAALLFVPVLIFLAESQARRALNARNEDDMQLALCDDVYDEEPKTTFAYLLAGMSLFVFTLGTAQGFPSGGAVFSGALQAVHQLSVVALSGGAIVWVLVAGRGFRFRVVWAFEAMLAIGSLACYLAGSAVPTTYGATLAVIPITLWLGIAFLVARDISCHTSLPAYVVLGLLYGTYTVMFNLGRLASLFFGGFFEQSVIALGIMVFLLGVSIVLVLMNPLPRKRPLFADLSSARGAACDGRQNAVGGASLGLADKTIDALSELAERRGLTERELQIALYLARGRSRRYISETLYLSENTVRNHMRNIYHKLEVHTKQEFIDLVERESRMRP